MRFCHGLKGSASGWLNIGFGRGLKAKYRFFKGSEGKISGSEGFFKGSEGKISGSEGFPARIWAFSGVPPGTGKFPYKTPIYRGLSLPPKSESQRGSQKVTL